MIQRLSSARAARMGTGELAQMQSFMREARMMRNGVQRGLRVPDVTPKRRIISASSPSRFYRSAAQAAADLAEQLILGQRLL